MTADNPLTSFISTTWPVTSYDRPTTITFDTISYKSGEWGIGPEIRKPAQAREEDPVDEGTATIIKDLSTDAAEPTLLEPGSIYVWMSAKTGVPQMVDLTGDQYLEQPSRKKGTVRITDVPSFATYHAKHKINGQTEIYSDPVNHTVTAILDAHHADYAAWQGHRLALHCGATPEWAAWASHDAQYYTQLEFAEFLDDHLGDIAPSDEKGAAKAADLLQLAQEFSAQRQVTYAAGSRLQNGATQLQYIETINAEGTTRSGSVAIPDCFYLHLRPFEDSEPVRVRARFRYRITSRALHLGYFLDSPDRIVRDAWKAVVARVAEVTGETIITGYPT